MDPSAQSNPPSSGAWDFDFLFGTWRVQHRKLKRRLAGETGWTEFSGETVGWPILGGFGNIDDNLLDDPSGSYHAITLRRYDPQANQWSIWWVDARTMKLETPVHGRFEHGTGTFYGKDTLEGNPICVRFLWSDITPHSARWEQAFSPDGGATWEVNWIMTFTRKSDDLTMARLAATGQNSMKCCCPVVELRQYTLHANQRDTLIELFDREFITPQESLGIQVLGQFRDLDDPDRFVWLRGFESMEARPQALGPFYSGDVWKVHRNAANATMLDSDNVLLLRPARPDSGFASPARDGRKAGVLTATIFYLGKTDAEAFAAFFAKSLRPQIEASGATVLGEFVTEQANNNFPTLPVRTDESVFIWFGHFEDELGQQTFAKRVRQSSGWRDGAPTELLPCLMRKPEILRLAPTNMSALR